MKMKNHSMFVAFAPRENPKIAIAVAIENAGFGATWAAPIASLLMEKYLFDSVSTKRKPIEEKMIKANLIDNYVYTIDSALRRHDAEVYEAKVERRRIADSVDYARDSVLYTRWIDTRQFTKK